MNSPIKPERNDVQDSMRSISKAQQPSTMSQSLVSIIICMYGKDELTTNCIDSIISNTQESFEIIVIDDNSPIPYKYSNNDSASISIYRNTVNSGYLQSCNFGISKVSGDCTHVCFLNNDTLVTEGWLTALLNCADKYNAGVVGSKLVYEDGTLQEAGGIYWNDAQGTNYGRMDPDPDKAEYNFVREVDKCSGACLLVKKSLIELTGGYDVRFSPAYKEDADLCFMARKYGSAVYYQPASKVIHLEGKTCGTDLGSGVKKYQELNRPKFISKWQDTLATDHLENRKTNVFIARQRPLNAKIALIIDDKVPEHDKHAGGLGMFLYTLLFRELGFKVTFFPDNHKKLEPYTSDLQQQGIEVLYGKSSQYYRDWIEANGRHLSVAWLSRPSESIKYISLLRQFSPARILYCPRDIHHIRNQRRFEIEGDPTYLEKAKNFKKIEQELVQSSDFNLVFTDTDAAECIKLGAKPESLAIIPAYYYETFPDAGLIGSSAFNILFVGGFKHAPNLDGINWFLDEIWPRISVQNQTVSLIIAGQSPPYSLIRRSSRRIKVLGYYKDLDFLYRNSGFTIAPLRYGSGIKGKIIDSMRRGCPVVTTPVGAEGMALTNFQDSLIAEDCSGFASMCNRLLSDRTLHQRLSSNAQDYVRAKFSKEKALNTLSQLIS